MTHATAPGGASFSSPLAEALAPEVLERFLRYVRVNTQSARDRDRTPSTPGQLDLARMLVGELRAIGLGDAELDEHGYVFATLPGADGAPVIGVLAHMDTSPDAPGAGVEPIVHRDYDGGAIALPRDGTVLDPADMPVLAGKLGHDIVTASGDTLLGADDKAGVAEIMAAVAHLAAHPDLPRPTLRVGFTPDEEIGQGAARFDVERFGAVCAYTLDGSQPGELQDETFSAAEVRLTVHGVDIHPGYAKGKLVNAARLAARIVAALPADRLTPETTADREGYIHPHLVQATAGRAEVRAIVRDFEDDLLEEHVALVRRTAEDVMAAEPRARLEVEVKHEYPNMRRFLEPVPEVVQTAERALRAEGIEPVRTPIRGGTDGSMLSRIGLPTPNLFTGGSEYHSPREWASVQDMASAAATIVRLAAAWADQRGGLRDTATPPISA
jgi:tripeptide aminopeptidase